MTLHQAQELLKEASLEYIRHGKNVCEVEHYVRLVIELQTIESRDFVGK